MGHITLEVFGALFILLIYCGIGIWFSEWDKDRKPWKTLYEIILRKRMNKLIKKYPKNYRYDEENDFYWYDSEDVSQCGRNALQELAVTQYMEDWSILMYFLWPIFGIIEYIRMKLWKRYS